jgi:hypothetical protein
MIKPYKCSQCGSTDFVDEDGKRVRCAYCGSLFQVLSSEPGILIQKGANVIFGKSADVEIRGDIDVQNGANVDIQGKVTVLRGKKQQEFHLQLIQDGSRLKNKS